MVAAEELEHGGEELEELEPGGLKTERKTPIFPKEFHLGPPLIYFPIPRRGRGWGNIFCVETGGRLSRAGRFAIGMPECFSRA